MKQIFVLILFVSILMVGCKSKEMAAVEEPPVVEEPVPEPEPEPMPEPAEILVVEERFTFDRTEDKASQDENTYFVILGSFSYKSNAERFMETLSAQGFSPVILLSETGFHRVSVNSYEEEIPARTRIQRIRNSYPEYHDLWLLIRKK
jgi:cell division protein FtsN